MMTIHEAFTSIHEAGLLDHLSREPRPASRPCGASIGRQQRHAPPPRREHGRFHRPDSELSTTASPSCRTPFTQPRAVAHLNKGDSHSPSL